MNKNEIFTLFEYNGWANQRILETTAKISPEQFTEKVSFGFGDLRTTLAHTLVAEYIWRLRWEGQTPVDIFEAEAFPTFAALQTRWKTEDQLLSHFIENVSESDLNQPVNYKTSQGVHYSELLWHLMVHLVNHGTQHRSEAAAMLTEFGFSPGELDFISFIRKNQ